MASGYWSPLSIASADGPTLTAAAAATCLPVTAKYTFPPNSFVVGSAIRVAAAGRLSCVITTPGTARFDIRLGSGVIIFDTGPLPLNTVAKTTVPFRLDILVTCRSVGTTGTFIGVGTLSSEALLGGLPSASGGSSTYVSSVSTGSDGAPAVSGSVDTTLSATFDCFFTQTVGTGSMTMHQFILETGTVALP